MAITIKQVREALKTVMDPELHVNIVDLGLVYKIQVEQVEKGRTSRTGRPRVKILMTLTTPGCPLAGMFDALVRHALKDIVGLDVKGEVEIELTFDPPWTLELMAPEVRAELGLD